MEIDIDDRCFGWGFDACCLYFCSLRNMRLGLNPDYNHNPNQNSYNQTRENMTTKKQPRFFVPTEEANPTNSWKLLLADPIKHWKRGHSVQCLAEAWENESGFRGRFGYT